MIACTSQISILEESLSLPESSPSLPVGLQKISIGLNGEEGNGTSGGRFASLSYDGTQVVFHSEASNLVAGDSNGYQDVFHLNLLTGSVVRISVATNGAQGNGDSSIMGMSDDGDVILFKSEATNLVAGDTNGFIDLFIHKLSIGETTMVSLVDGSLDVNGSSLSNGDSFEALLSGNGRYIAFRSAATNIVGSDTNGRDDTFWRDLETGETRIISRHSNGTLANNISRPTDISQDGQRVTFWTVASNLAPTNGNWQDVFVHNIFDSSTTEISLDSTGLQQATAGGSYHGAISSDGAWVSFHSGATFTGVVDTNGGEDIYLKNTMTQELTLISRSVSGVQGDARSGESRLSDDAKHMVFVSQATNLIDGDVAPGGGDHQVYLKQLETGVVTCLSRNSENGEFGDADTPYVGISGNGKVVVFESEATNLSSSDQNGFSDLFIYVIENDI